MGLTISGVNCPKCRGRIAIEEQVSLDDGFENACDLVCVNCGFRVPVIMLCVIFRQVETAWGSRLEQEKEFLKSEAERDEKRKRLAEYMRGYRERRRESGSGERRADAGRGKGELSPPGYCGGRGDCKIEEAQGGVEEESQGREEDAGDFLAAPAGREEVIPIGGEEAEGKHEAEGI